MHDALGYLLFFASLYGTTACSADGSNPGEPSSGNGGNGNSSGAGGAANTSGMGGATNTSGTGGTANATAGSPATTAGTGGAGVAGTANGGGGGTANPPPKTVLPCDALDESPVGEWQEITIDEVTKNVASLIVDPSRPGTVYVGAGAAMNSYGGPGVGIWKTTDCGASWNHLVLGENADELNSGVETTWAIDPNHPDTMYTNSLYGSLGIYRSENAGVDWTDITPTVPDAPTFTQVLAMDPIDPEHLVVSYHDNCSGEFGPQCLAESQDRGDSWTLMKGPGGGWQENAGPVVLGPNNVFYAAPVDGLFQTTDHGATWKKVAPNADPGPFIAQDGTTFLCTESGLLMSQDQNTWTKLENSSKCTSVVTDGTTIYTSYQNFFSGQPFYSAPFDDPTNWTNMVSAQIYQGAINMGYDPDHHVIYSSNNLAGMWRLRIE